MKSVLDSPLIKNFSEVTKRELFAEVPDEWFLFFSDVKNSTEAIRSGNYKSVNVVGASSIMATLNAVAGGEIAYVFGGDGATFLIPPQHRAKVERALRASHTLAQEKFNLQLRIGRVPVSDLKKQGFDLQLARLQSTGRSPQYVFSGTALLEAERWVKSPATDNSYLVNEEGDIADADFTGLECRWQPIPSQNGEIVTILVHSQVASAGTPVLYSTVIDAVNRIYGEAAPIQVRQLKVAKQFRQYEAEAKVRSKALWAYQFTTFLITNVGVTVLEMLKSKFWSKYKQDVVSQTDHRKFDGTLRMVLDGNSSQRRELESFLESFRIKGALVYGIHASPSALMTCLVSNRQDDHLHFLDGSSGGYVEAAIQMKEQLKTAH